MNSQSVRKTWQFGNKSLVATLLASAIALLLHSRVPAGSATDHVTPAPDPFADLNDAFRTAYRDARTDLLAKVGPIVIVEGDNLVLLRDGKRTEVPFMPQRYHDLKVVAHIPLAIAMLLVPGNEEELSAAKIEQLRAYREKVITANDQLDKRFDGDLLKRQGVMIRGCLDFLDEAIKNRKCTPIALVSFTGTYEWPIKRNADDAARTQIDALHKQMTAWRSEMTDEEWKKLKVVIIGSQMPRRDNVAVQYFAKLLGEPGEGDRIIYAESLWDEKKALDLLGTHFLDTWIGSAFFGDDRRMHRDLLGDAAKEYLQQINWK